MAGTLRRALFANVSIIVCLFIGGCKIVDSSIDSRVDEINGGFHDASNDEVLANIARAGNFEPLRFYLHSKIAPSQTSDVKIGLPNITVGPAKGASNHPYIFTSSLDNSAALSLELDPIETRDFHNTLLTPVSMGTLGILLQNFPRELVYFLLFDAVRFQEASKDPIEYVNSPALPSDSCPRISYKTYDPAYSGPENDFVSPYHPPGNIGFRDLTNCQYQRFVYWVETAMAYGLTVEFKEIPNSKYDPRDAKSSQPKTVFVGQFCFDPALARKDLIREIRESSSVCGKKPIKANDSVKDVFAFMFPFTRKNAVSGKQDRVFASIDIRLRSVMAVYTYLGQLLRDRNQVEQLVTLYSVGSMAHGDDNILKIIDKSRSDSCFASVSVGRDDLCVPQDGADNSRRVFAILSELTALSQSASDVPTSLTVRLTP